MASVKALRRDNGAAVARACLAKVLVRVWVMGISITVRLEAGIEGTGIGYTNTVEVEADGRGTVTVEIWGGATITVET
jgi:hypothetical protein